MALHDQIRDYYFSHLSELAVDKQFHFASRIAAWEGDERALVVLEELRSHHVPVDATPTHLVKSFEQLYHNLPAAKINAADYRQPYFDKYPTLRPLDFVLFRVRHLEAVYGIDARSALATFMPLQEMQQLQTDLLDDPQAFRALSTYAVNFLYLLQRVILKDTSAAAIPLQYLYDLGNEYDLDDPTQLQLFIYLYTHCIIGESNFYTKSIAPGLIPPYTAMLKRLEASVARRLSIVSLDNKLELLVCSRIIGYESELESLIQAECQSSVSDNGTFLVDRHNNNGQAQKFSFSDSEHRNVLYIMSNSPYRPHTTLLG